MEGTRFRPNTPNVMHETIEGEVILIDLTTGSYYSLRGPGASIWHAIEQGLDEEQIGSALVQQYDASPEELRGAVSGLVTELEAEGLIVENGTAPPSAQPAPSGSGNGQRLPFRAPVLEKFTDMQDLVLIDPVHQVAESGWPHPQQDLTARTGEG